MHQITYNQEVTYPVNSVPRGVTLCIYTENFPGKCLPCRKKMQSVLICRHRFFHLRFTVLRHGHPGIVFLFRNIYLRFREYRLAVFQHASYMVTMKMSDIQIVDIFRSYTQSLQ